MNAAKEGCLNDDGGVDGAITRAGGEALSQVLMWTSPNSEGE